MVQREHMSTKALRQDLGTRHLQILTSPDLSGRTSWRRQSRTTADLSDKVSDLAQFRVDQASRAPAPPGRATPTPSCESIRLGAGRSLKSCATATGRASRPRSLRSRLRSAGPDPRPHRHSRRDSTPGVRRPHPGAGLVAAGRDGDAMRHPSTQ
eukprot:5187675-Prymnesium_polylepis.1